MKQLLYILLITVIYFPGIAQQSTCITENKMMLKEGTNIQTVPVMNQNQPGGTTPAISGDRIIYWVHGLGGSPESWMQAGTWSQNAYKIRSVYPTYFGTSLASAAISLGQSIDNLGDPLLPVLQIEDPQVNYIIAHSQGGLVSRMLEKQYTDDNKPDSLRKFGGIVTFGSPHAGAEIAQNIPALKNYLANGIYTLSMGPILEFLVENWWLNLFVDANNLDNLINQFSQTFPNQILPVIYGDFAQKITEAYHPNAAELDELNSYHSEIPFVTIGGREEEPVLWRFLHSMSVDPMSVTVFSENEDDDLLPMVEQSYNEAKANELKYHSLYLKQVNDGCTWWQWLLFPEICAPLYCFDDLLDLDDYLGYGEHSVKKVRDAYAKAADWWLDANKTYKSFIGCYKNVSYVHPVHYICQCEYFDNGTEVIDINYQNISVPCENQNFPNANCSALPIIISNSWEETSDGVVTTISSNTLPESYSKRAHTMEHSNHQQMKNDYNTQNTLIQLYNGNFGNFFRTNPRNY